MDLYRRQKTDTAPGYDFANGEAILLKYADHPNAKQRKRSPILSNQKMNAYLKEIADCCGITKR